MFLSTIENVIINDGGWLRYQAHNISMCGAIKSLSKQLLITTFSIKSLRYTTLCAESLGFYYLLKSS